jgi:hypothetical protein
MNWTYLQQILGKIFSVFDNIFIKAVAAVWLICAGIHTYLYAVAALLLFDVLTGIYASIKRGESFTTKILKKGLLEKTVLYLILMGASLAMEMVLKKIFGWENYYVVFFVTLLITTYEFVSICENIYSINPNLTYLKSLIGISNRVRDKAIKYAEDKVDTATINVKTETKTTTETKNDVELPKEEAVSTEIKEEQKN